MRTAIQELFSDLWRDYVAMSPRAQRIAELIGAGAEVPNDHVAFRGLALPGLGIDAIAEPFVAAGYRAEGEYHFEAKKLYARHFEPPVPGLPKVFVSELLIERLSPAARNRIEGWARSAQKQLSSSEQPLARAGRPWAVVRADYDALLEESEYAAWLSVFGFVVNHFTVAVHEMDRWPDLETLNRAIRAAGYPLNLSGGEIKGSPEIGLEQSSTLAEPVPVRLDDGEHVLPGVYYEFARRHPLQDGALYGGFVSSSADRIFESTDARR